VEVPAFAWESVIARRQWASRSRSRSRLGRGARGTSPHPVVEVLESAVPAERRGIADGWEILPASGGALIAGAPRESEPG